MGTANIDVTALEAFCVAAMSKNGLNPEDAELSAKVFVTADTWGTFTHGTICDTWLVVSCLLISADIDFAFSFSKSYI